jgi:hypothetical protein
MRLPRALVALLLCACPQKLAPTAACTAQKPCALALQNVSVAENPLNVLSYLVEWQTKDPASTEVDVACGDAYSGSFTGTVGTDHRVLAMGLIEGTHCDVTVRSRTDTTLGTDTESIDVSALPTWLPKFTLPVANTAAMQPGWTVFPVSNGTDRTPLVLAIVDEQARIRWYHRRAIAKPGEATDVKASAQGLLTTGDEVKSALIGWDGKVVWEADLGAHHEIWPEGDERYLLIRGGTDCPDGHWSDTIFEWDRTSNTQPWTWRICDYYTPAVYEDDWTHANAIYPFGNGAALLVSVRNQNNLFKIDRATKQRLWVLGDGGDFTLAPADRFLRQHAPEILANGHILLFDNGLLGTREYSRAIEIAYDEGTKQASVVWEYRPTPDIFAKTWGDTDRLPNGNTLVTFGVEGGGTDVTHIIEVDSGKQPVWHLQMPPKLGAYRADRIDPVTFFELTD